MITPDLTIAGVTARAVVAPLTRPVRTAVGTIPAAPLVLIDVTTREGVTGKAYIFAYTPPALASLHRLVGDRRIADHHRELITGIRALSEYVDHMESTTHLVTLPRTAPTGAAAAYHPGDCSPATAPRPEHVYYLKILFHPHGHRQCP